MLTSFNGETNEKKSKTHTQTLYKTDQPINGTTDRPNKALPNELEIITVTFCVCKYLFDDGDRDRIYL